MQIQVHEERVAHRQLFQSLHVNPLTPTVAMWVPYSYKAFCARPGLSRSFVIFDIRALWRVLSYSVKQAVTSPKFYPVPT